MMNKKNIEAKELEAVNGGALCGAICGVAGRAAKNAICNDFTLGRRTTPVAHNTLAHGSNTGSAALL